MSSPTQHIAILGAGASGIGAARLAQSRGALPCVYDSSPPDRLQDASGILAAEGIAFVFGDKALEAPARPDLVVTSTGIDGNSAFTKHFTAGGAPLIGEIEYAWRCAGCPDTVGITGTNGKTTTTEITASLLNGCGVRTVAAGNYGLAYSEVVRQGAAFDLVTLELSSFQLETIVDYRPAVSVWMNFAADHMDRYASLEEYRMAKERIFVNQKEGDTAVVNALDRPSELPRNVITFTAYGVEADFTLSDGRIWYHREPILDYEATRLQGRHNAENVMAALGVALARGLSLADAAAVIREYAPAKHRCEWIAEIAGVQYVNDSKATNLHALESSLRGLETPVILIAGGKDKGLDWGGATELVAQKALHVVCIGEMRGVIARAWGGVVECHLVDSLPEAVVLSARLAEPGQTVLLAPGTSSFDMFQSYAHRGEVFREAVLSLQQTSEAAHG